MGIALRMVIIRILSGISSRCLQKVPVAAFGGNYVHVRTIPYVCAGAVVIGGCEPKKGSAVTARLDCLIAGTELVSVDPKIRTY